MSLGSKWHTSPTFLIILAIVSGLMALCLAMPRGLSQGIHQANVMIFEQFGFFYLAFVFAVLLIFVLLGFTPLGKIRLGGANARPDHGTLSWLSMLFCAGMGSGFMFWGAAEPLFHYMNPPLVGEVTPDIRLWTALSLTFFHWGLHPWAIYGMTALAVGFYVYNGMPYLQRFQIFSEKTESQVKSAWRPGASWLYIAAEFITVMAIFFGVAATLGMGVLQVEGGFDQLLGWSPSPATQGMILAVMVLLFLLSAIKGLDKGIKWFSNASMILSFVLLVVMLVMGPLQAMPGAIATSTLGYFEALPSFSLGLEQYTDQNWVNGWTVKYWSWWTAWAPFVGLFIALISKGRTVRELVAGVMLAPTLFSILWFGVFGVSAIHLQQATHFAADFTTLESANTILYNLLNILSHSPFWSWVCLLLVGISICNSLDSATYVMACLTLRKMREHPPAALMIGWGLLFGALAMTLLFGGGITLLQEITLITVLPFTFLLVLIFSRLLCDLIDYSRRSHLEIDLPFSLPVSAERPVSKSH